MRLKEDSSSWKSNGIKKRDFKHDNSLPVSRKPKSKKDTKKWCRGKVGVKHQFQLVERRELSIFIWSTHRCVNCGKKQTDFVKP